MVAARVDCMGFWVGIRMAGYNQGIQFTQYGDFGSGLSGIQIREKPGNISCFCQGISQGLKSGSQIFGSVPFTVAGFRMLPDMIGSFINQILLFFDHLHDLFHFFHLKFSFPDMAVWFWFHCSTKRQERGYFFHARGKLRILLQISFFIFTDLLEKNRERKPP